MDNSDSSKLNYYYRNVKITRVIVPGVWWWSLKQIKLLKQKPCSSGSLLKTKAVTKQLTSKHYINLHYTKGLLTSQLWGQGWREISDTLHVAHNLKCLWHIFLEVIFLTNFLVIVWLWRDEPWNKNLKNLLFILYKKHIEVH